MDVGWESGPAGADSGSEFDEIGPVLAFGVGVAVGGGEGLEVGIECPSEPVLADEDDVVVEAADKDGIVGGVCEPAGLFGA